MCQTAHCTHYFTLGTLINMCLPELPVDTVEGQRGAQPLEDVGVQRQAVDALEEGLYVGRALLLLLGRGLLDGPLHKLLDAAAAEVP